MKRSIIYLALPLIFVTNAMADETDVTDQNSQSVFHAAQSKSGLVVAVTEPGEVAADTAWLLSNQVQGSNGYAPILLVLKPENRTETLKSLNLDTSELPALIFLDPNGNELSRVVEAAPSTKSFQKKNVGVTSIN